MYLAKISKRLVVHRLQDHLEPSNILDDLQSGFFSRRRTETALFNVLDDLISALDNGNDATLILLDLSSDFDTIDYTLLLHRLSIVVCLDDKALA